MCVERLSTSSAAGVAVGTGEYRQAADERLCCICMADDRSIMLEPCRHVSMCGPCAEQVDKCPLCKATPTRKVPVYL